MDKILKDKIEKINKIRLIEAVYKKDEKICYLSFLVDNALDDEDQKMALTLCREKLNVNVALKFKKAIYDEESVIFFVKNYLKNKYPNILAMLDDNDITLSKHDENVDLTLCLFEDLKALAQKNGFVKGLIDDLAEHFFEKFTISFVEKKIDNVEEIIQAMEQKIELQIPKEKKENVLRLKVEGIAPLIGDVISVAPVALSNIKKPMEEVYIAGKVSFFAQKSYKKKSKEGVPEDHPFFTFVLDDGTAKINCTYFPTKASLPKIEKITDETNLVCFGKIELFNDRLSFRPKDISLCISFEAIQNKVEYKAVPQEYQVVFPQKYYKPKQINLLGEDMATTEIPNYLKMNKIVVFDLETTGLYYERDEIIEIGACKIENGEITETFETLIKPSILIPEETTKINNITNEMVANCASFSDVIGDFYKFCQGSVLVAYNAGFDKGFLDYYAEKCFYKFENKVNDAMIVAQQHLKGLRNYKLKTVLEKLGITNEGAHRAVHDAIATAKAFIILAKDL